MSASIIDKFAHVSFWEIERNGPVFKRIKSLVIEHQCGKSGAMQCLVCCGRLEDNYDTPVIAKCVLGHNHSETYGGCSDLKQVLLSEEEGGYPLAVKANIARYVLKKGTHEAKFVEWLELQKLIQRRDWPWSRPTLDQLRAWYPAPNPPAGHPPAQVAALMPAPLPMPVAMDTIVNVPPPPPGALFAAAVSLPSLADVLGGGSSLPPPPPVNQPPVGWDAPGGFDDQPDDDMGLGGGGGEEEEEEEEEAEVDQGLSAAERPWAEIKQEMTPERLCQNNFEECFKLLGLAPTASMQEIKRAYYVQAVRVHPDKVSEVGRAEAGARFKLLHMAFKHAYDMRERVDCGLSTRRQRQVVDVALLTFEPLARGEQERCFRAGGEITNADYSTGAAMPGIYMGKTLSGRTRTCYIALAQMLHPVTNDEMLHELGWSYYQDDKRGYCTKYEGLGDWTIDLCNFFCSAVCNPGRGLGRVGRALSIEELEALCPVRDHTNWIYTMLKFFLSRMDPDNSWVFADPAQVSNEDWASGIEAEPVFKALCWLIGDAPKTLACAGQPMHPLFAYLEAFCDPTVIEVSIAAMTLHNGAKWTTSEVRGKESSAPIKRLKQEIADYWDTQRDLVFYALPESGMDTFHLLMADLETIDPVEIAQAEGLAYCKALETLEPSAKRQRTIASTPTTGGSSSSTDNEQPFLLGDGSSAADPVVIE